MQPLGKMKLALLMGAAASAPVLPAAAEPPAEEFVGVTCGYAGTAPAGSQEGIYGGGPWLLSEVLPGTPSLPDHLQMTCSLQVDDSDPAGADAVSFTTTSIGPIVGVPPRRATFSAGLDAPVYVCTEVSWKVGNTVRVLHYDADPSQDGTQCASGVSTLGSTFVIPVSSCASSDAVLFGKIEPADSDASMDASFERSVQHLRGLRTSGTTTGVCGGATDEDG